MTFRAAVVAACAAVTLWASPGAHATVVRGSTAASLRRLRRGGEPTPDEPGLFGPPFRIPLVDAGTGAEVAEVQMRLAITPAEQHHGLMFIKSLPDSDGMLFLYSKPQQRVLWMKNTYVPLEAAWFTQDATLREVHHLYPLDLTYRWTNRDDITMGLELPEGFFEKRKITQPAESLRLDTKALRMALLARGVDPATYLGAVSAMPDDEKVSLANSPVLRGGGGATRSAADNMQ
mmetsp:Transcript_23608/g.67674  ORF Transcript_23608/g.67674 Transcript_23608/m.67674 type:complete len:233 (-) Transcript_23608:27-725(-)